jgi:DNA excision repair protein ERCC-4
MKRRGVPLNKRRRVRGGGPTSLRNAASGVIEIPDDDPDQISQLYLLLRLSNFSTRELHPAEIEPVEDSQLSFADDDDDYFELYENDDLVLVLPYDGDMDDRVLEEIRPRFVVMYEPNPAFIRRVEVSSSLTSLNTGVSSISSWTTFKSLFFVLCQFC